MNFFKQTKLLFLLGLVLFAAACHTLPEPAKTAANYDSDVFYQWNEFFIKIERHASGYRPGPAPRALAYMGLSAYEACISAMPENNSIASSLPGSPDFPKAESGKEYHWPTVVNASYAILMKKFFWHMASGTWASLFADIDLKKNQLADKYKQEVSSEVFDRSVAFGEAMANAVFEYSKADGGNDAFLDPQPTTYVPPSGTGLWQPTYPNFGRGMYPYWGQLRPLAMQQTDLLCKSPDYYAPFSNSPDSKFYAQAKTVQNVVNNIKSNGTGAYEDLWIGEFWSDDILNQTFSPGSRWVAVADEIVAAEQPNFQTCAELYVKLGMCMFDYSIACWKSKYYYNVERPVSFIRREMQADWSTTLNDVTNGAGTKGMTPPFPAYPSGHSGFGSAAASALTNIFGSHYAMTDRCHEFRTEFNGKPRSFNSFDEMATENAFSRVPLGVHYEMDCFEGLRLGYLAGKRVLELPWKK